MHLIAAAEAAAAIIDGCDDLRLPRIAACSTVGYRALPLLGDLPSQ
jgi:hypothetical protein